MLMPISDILKIKVMGKCVQSGYEYISACWMQTEWLTNNVNNKSNDCICF